MSTTATVFTITTLLVCYTPAYICTSAHTCTPCYAYTAPAAATDDDDDDNNNKKGEGEEKEKKKGKKKKKRKEEALLIYICSRPRRHWQITGLFRRLAVLFKEELEEDKDKDKK